jgi:hypothetical protein
MQPAFLNKPDTPVDWRWEKGSLFIEAILRKDERSLWACFVTI